MLSRSGVRAVSSPAAHCRYSPSSRRGRNASKRTGPCVVPHHSKKSGPVVTGAPGVIRSSEKMVSCEAMVFSSR